MTDDELKNLIAERDMLVQIKIDLTAKVEKLEATLAASDAELLSLKQLLRSDLLKGAQTHLLDGDNSIWRGKLDAFVASQVDAGAGHG
jgi:hypothetical protein